MAKIMPMIAVKVIMMCHACPVRVISRKMPKMYSGSSGTITRAMVSSMSVLNS